MFFLVSVYVHVIAHSKSRLLIFVYKSLKIWIAKLVYEIAILVYNFSIVYNFVEKIQLQPLVFSIR